MPPDPLTSACFTHSVLDYHRNFTAFVHIILICYFTASA